MGLSLLSLVAGTFLLVKTCKEEMCCRWFPKLVAYVVIVISILMLLSCGYWKIMKLSHHGWDYGKWGRGMHKGMMMKGMSPEKMQEMMKNCPMMQMMKGMEQGEEEED